jgi:ferredoxin
MKVSIDPKRCQGHTMCNMTAPELFRIKPEDGNAEAVSPVVPPGLEELARSGAANCPERAIIITED